MKTIRPVHPAPDFCLEIHLTELCNYSCSYCNLNSTKRNTFIDYEKLFSLNYPKNTRVFIMGGEPTIDKNFIEFIVKLKEHGFDKIDVQTNLTFNVDRMINELENNNLSVRFYGSFHMEYSKIGTFIDKSQKLKSVGMYGGTHLMWLSSKSLKCLNYYYRMTKELGNVSLEPTLPKSTKRDEWDDKTELKEFIDRDLLQYCDRLSPEIFIDGKLTTIGEALYDNQEKLLPGMKCSMPSNGVTFSVCRNVFYYCCFDLVLEREFDVEQYNKGWCLCKNNICCADFAIDKQR